MGIESASPSGSARYAVHTNRRPQSGPKQWVALQQQLEGHRLSTEAERILNLAATGQTQPEIARTLNLHRSAVWRRLASLKQLALRNASSIYRLGDLSPSTAVVEEATCDRVAGLIRKAKIPPDHEEVSLSSIPKEMLGNFFLFLVAICHQTSPFGKPRVEGNIEGRVFSGWDYLIAKFEQRVREAPTLLDVCTWASMKAPDFEELFSDPERGSLLTGTLVRTEFINDLGRHFLSRSWTVADELLDYCGARIASGGINLIGELSKLQAYRDPVFKKSLFFLALMRNSGAWRYVDEEFLGPPVDYHEIRGHLRLGTVSISDPALLKRIVARQPVEEYEDIQVRRAVFTAVWEISDRSGIRNPSRLHYYFWNIFRSLCLRELPRCVSREPARDVPARYQILPDEAGRYHCPFEIVCASAHQESPIMETRSLTDFY